MKIKTNPLDIALAKARQYCGTKQWIGCFTPAEIVALVEAGVKPAGHQSETVERARESIAKGEGGRGFFYFYPNGLKMRHPALTKHDKSAIL